MNGAKKNKFDILLRCDESKMRFALIGKVPILASDYFAEFSRFIER